jgi:response regulator RpfG family c-di-GMP phosphodiesterase
MEKYLLIVEDNPDISSVIEEVLGELFTNVIHAYTVDSAKLMLAQYDFSFIILDILLEKRNGAEVLKYLQDKPDNYNVKTPVAIISGMVTTEFIERNIKKYAGIFSKPFDHDILRTLVECELDKQVVNEEVVSQSNGVANEDSQDEIPRIKYDLPFPIEQLEEKVEKVLEQVKKNSKLKALFSQLKINRNKDNYVLAHIGVLINVATAIATQMDWNSDKTLEKFVYAAYLHDMVLQNRPDLARIKDTFHLELIKESLSPEDYKLVLDHPIIAAKVIDEMGEIPQDVGMLVRQHHELPKENGFPAKLPHMKIVPLASIFIVAHDMTHYILENPKWTVDDYLAKVKFRGGHFNKVISALNSMK